MTSSSTKTGLSTGALKSGIGSASLENRGSFSGENDLEYIIEIDSVSAGAEVGQATFKWSDGTGTWNASGVVTSSSYVALNNGIEIKFTSGTGDDFVINDTWYFKAINSWAISKTIDYDRDTRFRTNTIEYPNYIVLNLGSAQTVQALILYDHNITSTATIAIKANATDSWGAPSFSEAVTHNATKLLYYLSSAQTYQYWRLEITDSANLDNYIEIAELYLGQYLQLNSNFSYGSGSRQQANLLEESVTPYGVAKKRFFNNAQTFAYDFSYINDLDSLQTMFESLGDRASGVVKPLYFHEDYEQINDFWLVYLNDFKYDLVHNTARTTQLVFTEVLRSV